MIDPMNGVPRDPETLRRRGIIGRLLGGLNLRFPGLFALLAAVFLVDLVVPDFIPFVDEIVLALLTAIFGLWKDRRAETTARAGGGPPLPPPAPPLPPPPAGS
jgi:hypothetical protein